jgi:hypothetical protein
VKIQYLKGKQAMCVGLLIVLLRNVQKALIVIRYYPFEEGHETAPSQFSRSSSIPNRSAEDEVIDPDEPFCKVVWMNRLIPLKIKQG